MIVALLFAIVQAVINVLCEIFMPTFRIEAVRFLMKSIVVRRWGVGHHSWDVPLQNYQPMLNVSRFQS